MEPAPPDWGVRRAVFAQEVSIRSTTTARGTPARSIGTSAERGKGKRAVIGTESKRRPQSPSMQPSLFSDEAIALPAGMRFEPAFLGADEEAQLLSVIGEMALSEARYKQYTARRRVAAFGGKFDYDSNELRPAPEIPAALLPLRARVAAWLGVEPSRFTQMLVAEYRPGTPLGWHRDVTDFESIVGVSLLGTAQMKFRAYPPVPGRSKGVLQLELVPRSAYVLEGPARWNWQHSIVATRELRYSISLRTPRGAAPLLVQKR